MFIPYNDKPNYFFCGLQIFVQKFGHPLVWTYQSGYNKKNTKSLRQQNVF